MSDDQRSSNQPPTAIERSWLSDDPINGIEDDPRLDRGYFVSSMMDVLERVRTQSESSILGLIGPWGSGKSSVLNRLVERISSMRDDYAAQRGDKHGWHVAEFNPWLYGDVLSLHAGFFSELLAAVPQETRWSRTRESILVWGKRLAPVAGLAGLVGVDGENAARNVLASFEKSTVEQLKPIRASLSQIDAPILMVIDDLDRLTAEELLQVFKLVRLVGRLPNVYYLLSYDEQTLADLLCKTDLVRGGDERRALEYLEKIVQVRFDLPLLRHHQVDAVVDDAVKHLIQKHQIDTEPEDQPRLTRLFDEVFSNRLRTPRALKRFFGQIDAFFSSVHGEVALPDFVAISWLRTVEPGVYTLIQRFKYELLSPGRRTLRSFEDDSIPLKKTRDLWTERLTAARVAEPDLNDIIYLLGRLFPNFERACRADPRTLEHSIEPLPGRVAHPDYFDRYFSFGVPAEDIADARVIGALAELSSGEHGNEVAYLESEFHLQAPLILRKIDRQIESGATNLPALSEWLLRRANELEYEEDSAVFSRLEGLSARVLCKFPADAERQSLLTKVASDKELYLVASATVTLNLAKYGDMNLVERQQAVAKSLIPTLVHHIADRLRETLEKESHFDSRTSTWPLLWRLYQLDPDVLRGVFRELVEEGSWTALDLLACVVPTTVSAGSEAKISEFESTFIDDFFGANEALKVVPAESIEAAPTTGSLLRKPATDKNRRDFVLATLKELKDAT